MAGAAAAVDAPDGDAAAAAAAACGLRWDALVRWGAPPVAVEADMTTEDVLDVRLLCAPIYLSKKMLGVNVDEACLWASQGVYGGE